mgnify:CR=1 FL=1
MPKKRQLPDIISDGPLGLVRGVIDKDPLETLTNIAYQLSPVRMVEKIMSDVEEFRPNLPSEKVGRLIPPLNEILPDIIPTPPEVGNLLGELTTKDMTEEEKIETIAKTAWAQGYARGMCRFTEAEDFEECVRRLSRKIAKRVLKGK